MEITPTGNVINNEKDYSIVQKKMENLNKNPDDKKLMDACKEFESIFTYMMLKEMKKTVPDNGIIEKSQGSIMFEEMYLEELSKDMSNGDNGIGMAKILYDQFKKGYINL
ncbi:rod-binding protein [Tissierella sp.]|uniref:rod-binding protein n=1 Tax=Tissierella sp. TaxID=41274 RepID=UPI002867AE85|nr:rod-binding protein [Tissierella sp.]MDR7856932.1 rod-binding protein [Tissierella sp.]